MFAVGNGSTVTLLGLTLGVEIDHHEPGVSQGQGVGRREIELGAPEAGLLGRLLGRLCLLCRHSSWLCRSRTGTVDVLQYVDIVVARLEIASVHGRGCGGTLRLRAIFARKDVGPIVTGLEIPGIDSRGGRRSRGVGPILNGDSVAWVLSYGDSGEV